MTSAIAILTYRRTHALQTMLEGLDKHCSHYPIAIFEDCGNDGTAKYLRERRFLFRERDDLMATEYVGDGHWPGAMAQSTAFLGTINLGVAGNSNRALKWFMDTGCDHLCLCNDDLLVLGDFVNFYRQAHKDLGPGFFCFNDFTDPGHRWITARSRGYRLKIFPKMTGIMLSITRKAIEKVGYFDTRFGKFGEEHSDYTYRMRFAHEVQLDGIDQVCLDVEPTLPNGQAGPPVLQHQEVETSVTGDYRKQCDAEAAVSIKAASMRYNTDHYYRPFSLQSPQFASGLKIEEMPKYIPVTSN